MKNKGLTYALILVVGIVWYQVFVRVKSNFVAEEVALNPQTMLYSKKIVKPQDFKLQANYRNPFSGSLNTDLNKPINPNPSATLLKKVPEVKIPATIIWPIIKYYGLVRKTTSNQPRSLLSIDGDFFRLKQGETVLDNILVKTVTRDSVVVKYRGIVRVFRK